MKEAMRLASTKKKEKGRVEGLGEKKGGKKLLRTSWDELLCRGTGWKGLH